MASGEFSCFMRAFLQGRSHHYTPPQRVVLFATYFSLLKQQLRGQSVKIVFNLRAIHDSAARATVVTA